jgi:predicted ATPase
MAQQELNWISINGFKSIASSGKVTLRPINLIIGPNGSGKSNFIGVFAFLQAIKEGRLFEYVRTAGGADELLHFGSKHTQEIKIDLSFVDDVNGYSLTLKADNDDNLFALLESASFWDKDRYPSPYTNSLAAMDAGKEAGISNSALKVGIASWIRARLDRWRLYHVHDTSPSSPLRKTARVDDSDYLRPDGSNLAAFLYRLQQTEKYVSAYNLIRKTVQQIAPFFDDFLLRPDNLNAELIKLAWKHKGSDKYFGVAALSDGTLRFIALTTLFLQPLDLRPSVILVDEPELGLHPSAITLLASMIRQTSAETQIIASTQSPLLLDHFDPIDVLVATRVNGATTLSRLESEPLKGWLEDYSLGQLWEKNELGGRPVAEQSIK